MMVDHIIKVITINMNTYKIGIEEKSKGMKLQGTFYDTNIKDAITQAKNYYALAFDVFPDQVHILSIAVNV